MSVALLVPNNHGVKLRDLDAIVVGWGRDEEGVYGKELKKANVTVFSPDYCAKELPTFKGFDDVLYCALDESGNEGGVCHGDSGGPLFHFNLATKRFELIGIVQGGERCGVTPDVYTDVNIRDIRSWIWGELFYF